jgi:hypothetical protein
MGHGYRADRPPTTLTLRHRTSPVGCTILTMKRFACVGLALVGCYRAPASQGGPAQDDRARESTPHTASGGLVFTEGTVHAFRQCTASAPPQLLLQAQTGVAPVFAIAITLQHGSGDATPRSFTVGGTSQDRCDPGCTGTVVLESLAPGTRARGRLDLAWSDGRIARHAFDFEWRGGRWEVRPCPGPPDAPP